MDKSHREHVKLNALPDPRPENERINDLYLHHLCMVPIINWIVKTEDTWKKYTLRNQDGAGACVGNGIAKGLEAQDHVVYSAHPIYSRRANAPQEGMWIGDGGQIVVDYGTTTEALDPSNNMSEAQMNAPVTMPTLRKAVSRGFVPITDLDALAHAIDVYGAVPLTIDIAWDEWNTEQGVPHYIPGSQIAGGHCICGVDYMLWNGEKAILAENSWGNDPDSIQNSGRVILTESFLKSRGTGEIFLIKPATMQTVILKRGKDDGKEVIGTLSDGSFLCNTLERPWLNNQPNISCVPKGTYQCIWSHMINMNEDHYQIMNVPGRTSIFIHEGNFCADSHGCILLGNTYADINKDSEPDVLSSRVTLSSFETMLNKQPFTLIIQ